MKKRLFAGLLALCMTVNLMSATAFAEEASNEPAVECTTPEKCVDGVHGDDCAITVDAAKKAEEAAKAKCLAKCGEAPETHLEGCDFWTEPETTTDETKPVEETKKVAISRTAVVPASDEPEEIPTVATVTGVAKIGNIGYATIEEAVKAANGEEIILLQDTAFTILTKLEDTNLDISGDYTLTLNDKLQIGGVSTLDIDCELNDEVIFSHGAVIKDSKINGKAFVAGKVTFSGDNKLAMLTDFGVLTSYYGTAAPMEWSVEEGGSLTMTEEARYGLGYGDNVTITGSVENALTARESLTEEDLSFFTHGLVAQESNGWNKNSSFAVKNAYVTIGSNNSFGNKPNNYGGFYKFDFDNVVLDSSRITFYEALSKTELSFKDSDVRTGTFMTNDADSKFNFVNTKLLSTTITNGNDEGNYNAGVVNLEKSSITYSAAVRNNGTYSLDTESIITAPAITGTGKIVVDASELTSDVTVVEADLSGFTGTVEVIENESAGYEITDEGLVIKTKYVAEVGGVKYETLVEAIKVATTGTKITLLVDTKASFDIENFTGIELDLNGKTLTLGPAVGSTGTVSQGFRVLYGSGLTIKDGTIKGSNVQADGVQFAMANYGTLTLENVNVEVDDYITLVINNRGTLNLLGTTQVPSAKKGYKLAVTNDPYDYTNGVAYDAVLNIKGKDVTVGDMAVETGVQAGNAGKIVLNIEGGTFGTIKDLDNGTTSVVGNITGGKFGADPSAYVATGYESVAKESNYLVGKHELKAVAGKSPSCTSTGIKDHYKCDTCGRTYSDAAGKTLLTDLVASAKGHKMEGTGSDSGYHWSVCTRCGATGSRSSHSYSNGKCSCGHTVKVEVYVPETPAPAPAPTTPAPTTTTTQTTTQTTTTTKPVEEAAKPVETPVEEVVVDTKIVEEVASEEVKEAVKETVTVAETKEVEKETGTVTEVKVAVTTETVDKVIENTEAGATVILPLTEVAEEGQAVTEAEVAVEALEKIVEAEAALTVEFEGVKVTFESETIKAIAEQAQGSTIELRVVPVEHHELNEEQQAVLEEHDVAVCVSAQIFSDGEYIGDFKGGKARIAIPFTPEEGKAAEHHKVYFVDDNGEMTLMPAVYVDGHMVFETNHFSDYVIVYEEVAEAEVEEEAAVEEEAVAETVEEETEKAGLPIVPIIIIVVAIILVVAFVATRKRNDEE